MRADAKAKRQAILDAAWHLVAARGVEVSMRELARQAKVGDATLYRHFPTSGELIASLLFEVFERIGAVIDSYEDDWRVDAASAWYETVRAITALGFGALGYRIATAPGSPALVGNDRQSLHDRLHQVLGPLLQRAASAGLVDLDLPVERFFAGLAAISRPLPDDLAADLAGQHGWQAWIYVRGLRPDRAERGG